MYQSSTCNYYIDFGIKDTTQHEPLSGDSAVLTQVSSCAREFRYTCLSGEQCYQITIELWLRQKEKASCLNLVMLFTATSMPRIFTHLESSELNCELITLFAIRTFASSVKEALHYSFLSFNFASVKANMSSQSPFFPTLGLHPRTFTVTSSKNVNVRA